MGTTEIVTAIIGVIGGVGGIGAFLTSIFQRKKIRAEAADVLTDTAITLVEPLQRRVKEVTDEAREARAETRQAREETRQARAETQLAREEMSELRADLGEVMTLLRRWRAAVLNPHITREQLQEMVRAESPPTPNGRADSRN